MKTKHLLLTLLMALMMPWAVVAQQALPYSYGFEDNDLSNDGWVLSGATNGSTKIYEESDAPEGSHLFKFHYSEHDAYLISPLLTGTGNGVDVSFQYMRNSNTSSYEEQFKVGYTTDESVTDPNDFTYGDIVYAGQQWLTYDHFFPANTKRIAIKYIYINGFYLRIDDFNFEAPSACPRPTLSSVNPETVEANQATMSWTENGNATSWIIEYSTSSSFTNAVTLTQSGLPYKIIDNLNPSTTYYVRVKSDCGGGDQSNWSNVISFTTLCDVIYSYPWTENFNSLTVANAIPNCWDNSEGTTTNNNHKWGYNTYTSGNGATNGTSHDGSNCVRFNSYGNSSGNTNFLKTPVLNFPAGMVMQLAFWWKNPTGGSFDVYISTDGGSTYTTALATALVSQSSWTEEEIDLTDYVGAHNVVIVFKGTSNYGNGDAYLYLDDVTIKEKPTCHAPTNLAANNVTNHTATISWEGTSDSYDLKYRVAAYIDGSAEGFDNNDIPTGWLNRRGTLQANGTANLAESTDWSFGTRNNVFDNHAYMNLYGNKSGWLITPEMAIESGDALGFDLAYTPYSNSNPLATGCTTHWFAVLVSTDAMQHWTILREWNNNGSAYILDEIPATGQCIDPIDLNAYVGLNHVRFAFVGHTESNNYDNNIHIDNVAFGTPVSGTWEYITDIETESQWLNTLDAETKYEVQVRGNCGSLGYSNYSAPFYFTTLETCAAPTDLAVTDITNHSVTFTWEGDASDYYLDYRRDDEPTWWTILVRNAKTVTITDLQDATLYHAEARAICSNNYHFSDPCEAISFETICYVPTDLAASNVVYHSATVTWTGESDSYNIRYCSSTPWRFEEGFEDASSFANWTAISNNGNNTNSQFYGRRTTFARTGSYGYSFSSRYQANDYNQYLISPEKENIKSVSFYYKESTSGYDEMFRVGYSTTTNDVAAFTWLPFLGTSSTSWRQYSTEDFPTGVKYIAINYRSNRQRELYIDDITITGDNCDSWQTATSSTASCDLENLTDETTYYVQVQGVCSGVTGDWSEGYRFTTLKEGTKIFTTAGNWNDANNWTPSGAPTLSEDAIIQANATIPNGYVATANSITYDGATMPITIADGGQLIHKNEGVFAIVEKEITGYTGEKDHYYLIGVPQYDQTLITPTEVLHMLENDFDLYAFEQAAADGLEWRNYKAAEQPFFLYPGVGYLYANSEDVTLSLETILEPLNDEGFAVCNNYVALSYTNGGTNPFNGWNLVSNPWAFSGYMYVYDPINDQVVSQDFYRMGENGIESIASQGAVAPWEAVFVEATAENQFAVVYFEPLDLNAKVLNMTVSQNGGLVDNARIRFGKGRGLVKFQLNPNHTKLYIHQDNKNYAVVYSEENMGEMPVSFEAESNGTYTLNFTTEELSFAYLHLIDNLTGIETDLLQTPSYSFEARTTDYTSRFKLVFCSKVPEPVEGPNQSFAFYSNGSWVINNESRAVLQVVDVNGRIIKSESINGCANINFNAAPGVYMLRLINGENVMVQKVVVK